MSAFADTSFCLALSSPQDRWHRIACELSEDFSGRVVTSEYVLFELGALMSGPKTRQIFIGLVRDLVSDPLTEIVGASSQLFTEAVALYETRLDKAWSLTDCASFIVMNRYGLTQALTSDHHFEQAGFVRLLATT